MHKLVGSNGPSGLRPELRTTNPVGKYSIYVAHVLVEYQLEVGVLCQLWGRLTLESGSWYRTTPRQCRATLRRCGVGPLRCRVDPL